MRDLLVMREGASRSILHANWPMLCPKNKSVYRPRSSEFGIHPRPLVRVGVESIATTPFRPAAAVERAWQVGGDEPIAFSKLFKRSTDWRRISSFCRSE